MISRRGDKCELKQGIIGAHRSVINGWVVGASAFNLDYLENNAICISFYVPFLLSLADPSAYKQITLPPLLWNLRIDVSARIRPKKMPGFFGIQNSHEFPGIAPRNAQLFWLPSAASYRTHPLSSCLHSPGSCGYYSSIFLHVSTSTKTPGYI